MAYEHFFPHPNAGNRYYLNEAQRQVVIECALDLCEGNGWDPDEIAKERELYESWSNKDLVEMLCGHDWLGFVGQTTELK